MNISYFLNTKYLSNNFSVPSVIVDEYIKSADGNALKVLLLILRNTAEVPTLEQLSLQIGISVESVKNALKFWANNGVIIIKDENNKSNKSKNYQAEFLNPSMILQLAEDDKNIKDILNMAEKISGGNSVSPIEMSSLISAYNYLGMPKDVILALYSDCKLNNINMKTFDNIISKWASDGVTTLEDANKYLHFEQYGKEVAKIFHLKYLLPQQRDLVMFWNAKNFPLEIVQFLYNKFSNNNNDKLSSKANIRYINAIIVDWISKGINTMDKVKEYIENSNGVFSSEDLIPESKPSYDIELFLQQIYNQI